MSVGNTTFRGKVSLVEAGDNYDQTFAGLTTPGVLQDLFNITVPVGKQIILLQSYVICRQASKFEIKKDTGIIGSGRTGAGESNANFSWMPFRVIDEGEVLKLEFFSMAGFPVVDVEAYFQARLITK